MGAVFEIAGPSGHLGVVAMTPSNVERYRADFSSYLEQGVLLTGVTVPELVIDNDAVVNRVSLSNDCKSAIWYVESTDDPASFNVSFYVTTNDGQTLNYTVQYNVPERTW